MAKFMLKNKALLNKQYAQTGSRKSIQADISRKALPSGYRRSKTGNFYFEARKNRTDIPGTSL
jgi:hypothetical protein